MSSLLRTELFFLICVLPITASLADTLEDVQERLQVEQTRQYQYREVRKLQLLEQDWVASGEMIIARQQIAIAQQNPRSILISINPSRMLYLDRDSGIRRVRAVGQNPSLPGLQPLMQLFHSHNKAQLEALFHIQFENEEQGWRMVLIPKDASSATSEMELSGPQGGGPDHIGLTFKNGDSTEWYLNLLASAQGADQALQRLLQQSSE